MKVIKVLHKALFVLSLTVVLLTGCAPKPVHDISRVNVACFPNITHAQALVMKEQGVLENKLEDTVEVNWITFNAGPSEMEALFAGEVDIGYIGPVPAVSGYIQSNGDLRIIAGVSNGGSVIVARKDSGIESAKDLDGKIVSVPQFGNTQHLSLLSLLNSNDLSPTTSGGTVQVVPSSNADVSNLMDQKNIDAAIVPEPWGSILLQNPDVKLLLDYDKIDNAGIPSTAVVIVRKDFLDNHRDIVEKFMEAHKEVTLYINENQKEAKKAINRQLTEITQKPIADDVLDSSFERMDISYAIPADSIMNFAKICVDENFITKLPDDEMIDASFTK